MSWSTEHVKRRKSIRQDLRRLTFSLDHGTFSPMTLDSQDWACGLYGMYQAIKKQVQGKITSRDFQ
jgi:hypothetical protein